MTMHTTKFKPTKTSIFALHSSASNGKQWDTMRSNFETEFTLFTPNFPGDESIAQNNDIKEKGLLIDALPIISQIEATNERVHLVGHSFGGAVALNIAINRPDLVKSLSIYEPACFHFLKDGSVEQRRRFSEINLIAAILSDSVGRDCPEFGMMHFIDFWNGKGTWAGLPKKKRDILVGFAKPVMSNFHNGMQEPWKLADLAAVKVPTLVMMGTGSPLVAQTVATALANSILGASSAIFGELDHMAPVTQPERILPVVREHISYVESSEMTGFWPLQSAA